jgi:FMN phosphatase YigB (HAD superfamily)
MIGDGSYDIHAGIAAGMGTIWISHGRPRDFDVVPDRTVRDLLELHEWLKQCTGRCV